MTDEQQYDFVGITSIGKKYLFSIRLLYHVEKRVYASPYSVTIEVTPTVEKQNLSTSTSTINSAMAAPLVL